MLHEEHGIWSELWKIGGIEIAERRAIIWGKSESVSHSVMSDSLQPCGLYVARQAPLSIGFSRQEYWSGLPFPSPGDLPNPGIKPRSAALQANSLPAEPPNGWPIWGKENGKCNGKETRLCNMLAVGASEGKIKKQGKKDPTFLFSAILCVVEFSPHHGKSIRYHRFWGGFPRPEISASSPAPRAASRCGILFKAFSRGDGSLVSAPARGPGGKRAS